MLTSSVVGKIQPLPSVILYEWKVSVRSSPSTTNLVPRLINRGNHNFAACSWNPYSSSRSAATWLLLSIGMFLGLMRRLTWLLIGSIVWIDQILPVGMRGAIDHFVAALERWRWGGILQHRGQ